MGCVRFLWFFCSIQRGFPGGLRQCIRTRSSATSPCFYASLFWLSSIGMGLILPLGWTLWSFHMTTPFHHSLPIGLPTLISRRTYRTGLAQAPASLYFLRYSLLTETWACPPWRVSLIFSLPFLGWKKLRIFKSLTWGFRKKIRVVSFVTVKG